VIHRRREGELVKPGINIMWEPLAKGAILKTPWFSWYVTWNRHTRRVVFAVPHGFNWRAPLGPWKRIADMQMEIDRKEREILALDHALHQSNDRYDKIRETNVQLRDALSLYRNA
jgi:hypothetical protein